MKIIIPLPPVTKKNSQRILKNRRTGKHFIAPSEAYEAYHEKALWMLSRYPKSALDTPVNMKCTYFMPTRRVVDLCNLLECTCDVLVDAGVLKDDNSRIVVSHDGSRVLLDPSRPRTEIEITEVQP